MMSGLALRPDKTPHLLINCHVHIKKGKSHNHLVSCHYCATQSRASSEVGFQAEPGNQVQLLTDHW